MEDDKYMKILAGYTSSVLEDFESYLRAEVDLVEEDIKMVLDEYNSSFMTYELEPRIYTFEGPSESLYNILQPEYPTSSSQSVIELDDNNRKAKLVVRSVNIAMRFDKKSFFCTVLGFAPCWDYKHYNEYISRKNVNLSTLNKIHLESDVIDGSNRNRSRQPILFSFILDKPPGYQVFCQPETIHFKKINKFVLSLATLYLEDNNKEEVDFNGETLTFTLQMIEI